jgi:hypothetical protein
MSKLARGRVPKALYVLCSAPDNPHANGRVEVFTNLRDAERACRWGDQRVVTFVQKTAERCNVPTLLGRCTKAKGHAGDDHVDEVEAALLGRTQGG